MIASAILAAGAGPLELLVALVIFGLPVVVILLVVRANKQRHHPAPIPAADAPPPAWYPDPSGDGQRYWDGARWTEHHQPSERVRE